jgi:hypothetical protein
MGSSSSVIWLCGHCGRPVADNPIKWIGVTPFHVECTMSPYANPSATADSPSAVSEGVNKESSDG